ncbi:alpha/beta hydrolase [Rhodococcus sp. BL-253-APC-6A1W]|uniref:alpha/beta fold hydrolase n=1 Tax=Rhodococcus sp. BL-253-APC-6A1W TaxID=2725307 RepID=UPI001F107376|nr:alpha/beta hydrolase [Rhodococcus sp. BL-253-APC-6A1W]
MSERTNRADVRPDAPGRDRGPHRWLRRTGMALTVVLSAVGVVGIWQFFSGAPGVGHFRDAEGREIYVETYDRAMSALPPPTATHDLATRFGSVRVYEWFSGGADGAVPVVLIPGMSSGVPMWAENLGTFLPHRRVLAFDALGDAGLSIQSVPLSSTEQQALWISEVLDELAPEGAHVVGHSFGGASAAAYAHRFPERVRSLTLLEPVFTFAYPPVRMLAWTMISTVPFLPESWHNTALGKVGGAEFDPNDDMSKMIAAASEHFSAQLPTPSPLNDAALNSLVMPTYVAIAERDSLAGGRSAAERARRLPDATVDIVPDTTHSLPMQAKDFLAVKLPEFWRDAERG